ncbi:MAG: hypothetical protein JRJ87_18670 [Deltaproteobacteria bacterium]|nr:hypothetical protein [Deltaproteobacteria bacterium]
MPNHQIKEELLKDEKILWTGQPDPSVHFAPGDAFLLPAGIIFIGFGIVWVFVSLGFFNEPGGAGRPNPLFAFTALPPLVIGFYLVLGRYLVKIRGKRRTYYAVTDQRAIALLAGSKKVIMAANIKTVPIVTKTIKKSGIGNLRFGNSYPGAMFFENVGMNTFSSNAGGVVAFYDIKDAEEVFRLVSEVRSS